MGKVEWGRRVNRELSALLSHPGVIDIRPNPCVVPPTPPTMSPNGTFQHRNIKSLDPTGSVVSCIAPPPPPNEPLLCDMILLSLTWQPVTDLVTHCWEPREECGDGDIRQDMT